MRKKYRPRQRGSGCGCIGLMLLTLIIVALIGGGGIVFLRSQMQGYSSLDTKIKIAQVCAYSTPTSPPTMDVHVILYDNNGNITFEKRPVGVAGDQVQLQGDIIKYWSGLNPVLQSGYKLTSLQGSYSDPTLERNYKPVPIPLNGGDDSFYKTMRGLPSGTPGIKAMPSKPLPLMGDGHTYDIFVSQDGLSALQVTGPLACGFNSQRTS